jgi:hypothetical protein
MMDVAAIMVVAAVDVVAVVDVVAAVAVVDVVAAITVATVVTARWRVHPLAERTSNAKQPIPKEVITTDNAKQAH